MVKLGKVTVIYTGTGFPKELQGCKEGKYPFYKVGDIFGCIDSDRLQIHKQ